MKKLWIFLLLLLLFQTQNALAEEKRFLDATLLYEAVQPSLCLVVSLDPLGRELKSGSGFVVSKEGQIITNSHVVSGAESVKIECGGQKGKATHIVRYKTGIDLVVLQTNLNNPTPLVFSSRQTIKPGEVVFALGNPYGLTGTITSGIVGGTREFKDANYLQISADINPGNSGGPIMDSFGNVVGIATFKLEGSQGINFALTAETVSSLPTVNVPFAQIISPDQEVSVVGNQKSSLSFRGLYLGSECAEVLKKGELVDGKKRIGQIIEEDLSPSRKELINSQKKIEQITQGILNDGRGPVQLNQTGENYLEQDLIGKTVIIEYECLDGIVVKAGYPYIQKQISSTVFMALKKKYGKPKDITENFKINDIQLSTSPIKKYFWDIGGGQKIIFMNDLFSSSVFYLDEELSEFLKEKRSLKLLKSDEI